MDRSITVRIPDDLREILEQISRSENKPVSDVVRESIRKYVSVYRFRKLRSQVLPFAEAQGFLTDEDIFRDLT